VLSDRHVSLVHALHHAADAQAELFELHLATRERLDAPTLRELAWIWAGRLHAAGVRRGDPVPILLPTGIHFVAALLGVQWLGAVPAPLATPMTFGSVTRYLDGFTAVVEDSGAGVVIASSKLREAIAALPIHRRLRDVLVPGEGALAAPPSPDVGPADLGLLQYTSGTTGRPKGVAISHRAIVSNAAAIAHALTLREDDVGVSWLPLFHDMGLVGVLMTAICHPYRVHLLAPQSFAMKPRRWLELIAAERATITAAPNFAYQMCAERETKNESPLVLDCLRAALNGSELVHAQTLTRFEETFAPQGFSRAAWRPVYGMAENTLAITMPKPTSTRPAYESKDADDSKSAHERIEGPQVVTCDREALLREGRVRDASGDDAVTRSVAVGEPVRGTEVRVRREGRACAPGEVGEIQVRGVSRMEGYFGRPELTESALDDGWLRTGDLGFVRGGQLHVIGRTKEVVVKGGRNVHPPDVERVACERAEVRAAAAWGSADERRGTERLHVRVETRERDPAVLRVLEAGIRGDVLAALGVRVDDVSFCGIGALPRTTSGKIRRSALSMLEGAVRKSS
jgi:acyl-CoA synthetase (AMP-forming)/AMP-acid ligase II